MGSHGSANRRSTSPVLATLGISEGAENAMATAADAGIVMRLYELRDPDTLIAMPVTS